MSSEPDVAIASDDPTLGLVIYAQRDATDWSAVVAAIEAFAASFPGASMRIEPIPDGAPRGSRVGRVVFASRLSRAQAEAAASALRAYFARAGLRV